MIGRTTMIVEERVAGANSLVFSRVGALDVFIAMGFALAGVLLRLPLMGHGLWRDEGSTYAVTTAPSVHELLNHVWTTEMTPPLFYLLERAWVGIAGTSEIALRTPSLLFGIATIALMYAIGYRIAGRPAAIVAALCSTIAPGAIGLDTEARAYSLTIFIAAIFLYGYVGLATGRGSRVALVALTIVSGALLPGTFVTGFVIVGASAAFAFVQALIRRDQKSVVLAASTIAASLLSLLFAPWALHYAGAWHECCLHLSGLPARIELALRAFSPFGSIYRHVDALLAIGIVAWLATLPFRTRDRIDEFIGLSVATISLGIALSAIQQLTPERHFVPYAPIGWILVALLCIRFAQWVGVTRSWRWLVAAPIAFGVACAAIAYPAAYEGLLVPLSNVRSAVAALEPFRQHPLLVVAAPDYLGATLNYYLQKNSDTLLRGVATWDNPQFYPFDPLPWDSPNFTTATVDRIEQLAREKHALIVLFTDPNATTFDGTPFARALSIVAPLQSRNDVLYSHVFPSARETVHVTVLAPPA
jgi:4-amino-4-deoxy-L-arabinose transferase-like glycosyltransferase